MLQISPRQMRGLLLLAAQLFHSRVSQERRSALHVVVAHVLVNFLDDEARQSNVDLLGPSQLRRDVDFQHVPAHVSEVRIIPVRRSAGWHWNGLAAASDLLQHDVRHSTAEV